MNVKINWSKVSDWLRGASITLFALGLGKLLFTDSSEVVSLILVYFGLAMGALGVVDVDNDDPDSS